MRPLLLQVQGFTSFRETVTVPFSELELFAICGPTGAGKTSLIDAMIFALYGRTPRLGEKSAQELITQNAAELKVLLEFRVSGQDYRISRRMKRGASGMTVRLDRRTGESWESLAGKTAEVKDLIPKILGLDYDGFTRSVVLPQGEFDRFLRGDSRQRREILKRLLQLDAYDRMMQLANQRAKEASTLAELRQQDLIKYADATPQALEQAQDEHSRWRDQQQKITARRNEVEAWRGAALKLRTERLFLERVQEDARQAASDLRDLQARSVAALQELEQSRVSSGSLQSRIERISYDRNLHLKLKALEPLAQRRAALLRSLSELQEDLERARGEEARLKDLEERSRKAWDEAHQLASAARERSRRKEEEYTQAKARHGPAQSIRVVAQRVGTLEDQKRQRDQLQASLAANERTEIESQARIEQLETDARHRQDELDLAEKELGHLRHLYAAQAVRLRLRAGEACPVCGQLVTVVPAPGAHTGLEEAERRVKEARIRQEQVSEALARERASLANLPRMAATIQSSLAVAVSHVTSITAEIERVLGAPVGPSAAEDLKRLEQRLQRLEEDWDQARREEKDAGDAEAAAQRAAERNQSNLQLARERLKEQKSRFDNDSAELKATEQQLEGWTHLEELQSELHRLHAVAEERDRLEEELRRCRARVEELNQQNTALQQSRSECEARLARAEEDARGAAGRIHELVTQLDPILAGLPPGDGLDEAARLDAEVRRLNVDADAAARAEGQASERVGLLRRRIEEAAGLRQEIERERERAALHNELGRLLRADQFIDFVLEEAMARISSGGSAHLYQLSAGRYTFATERDEFFVVDEWNAGEKRSVHTLSGGESFLASLSLALALAGSVAELSRNGGAATLESLFLDEGFSTLDSEALGSVVSALITLATGDRMIGVISHVAEMAEDLPARVVVEKSVAGSRVRVEL